MKYIKPLSLLASLLFGQRMLAMASYHRPQPAVALQVIAVDCLSAQRHAMQSDVHFEIARDLPSAPFRPLKPSKMRFDGDALFLQFVMPPGNYKFVLVRNLLSATFSTPLIEGHDRHVAVRLCNSVTMSDTDRSIYGTLPAAGYAVEMSQSGHTIPVFVDGEAYYGVHLPSGAIRLRVYFVNGSEHCDWLITAKPKWQYDHKEFNVNDNLLRTAQCG